MPRDADPRAAYAWERSAELADSPAILALRRQALARPPRARWRLSSPGFARRAGAVAAAASAIAAAWLVGLPRLASLNPGVPAALDIVTGPGEQREVHLDDGTTIRLEGRSAIRVADDGRARHVALLAGRAYFDVQHDAAHPFLVDAAGGQITDIGTRFTVDRSSDRVTVSLIEGKVAVRGVRQAAPLALAPGEQASFGAERPARKLVTAPSTDPLDWTHGVVELNDVPLARAVDILSRYTARPIHLGGDPGLDGRRVTGVFRADSAAGFATTLASALDLEQTRAADGGAILSEKKQGG